MPRSQRASKLLESYLNDHLAGAEGALDLMRTMRRKARDEDFVAVLDDLRRQITEDRDTLVDVITRLGVHPGRMKRLLATVSETMGRVAIVRLGAPSSLSRLLAIEMLSGGIWLKMRLWEAMSVVQRREPALADIDFEALAERARRQLDALEPHHAGAAERVLAD